MMRKLCDYPTVVFDCDGVVLDSNRVKTQAFYDTVVDFGVEAADKLVEHHKANGGVSRFKKFDFFLSDIADDNTAMPSRDELVATYAGLVKQGLLVSKVEPSLEQLRKACPDQRWLIASGGAQDELRWVFREKGIDGFFDGGIFGSPDPKEEILNREIRRGNILTPALFVGDSKYDYHAATEFNLDFVFLSQWTEVADWKSFCSSKDILAFEGLKDLLVQ